MSCLGRVAAVVFLAALVALGSRSVAQNDPLKDWLTVPTDQGGLVLILADINQLIIGDAAGKHLDGIKWPVGVPLIRQVRLKPGSYQIRLKGPLESVGVATMAGSLTFLRLVAFKGNSGEQGLVAAGWSGIAPNVVPKDVVEWLRVAAEKETSGAVYATPFIQTENNILTLNTEPPWPIPPPPKR